MFLVDLPCAPSFWGSPSSVYFERSGCSRTCNESDSFQMPGGRAEIQRDRNVRLPCRPDVG